ncbi:protein FAR1-RELATED SEQUENCE 5 [Sorghum bicolor]|uniref:protein FAR1-RELATED SEQUENCE 5 n=1 Tax=Sorghum bicolor TaxID=4558 RepID=UPI000B425EC3|nr:protein FAR1-RELATED SEQUENCE 5 [Sorghum bicolor]|eukprot:XP_021307743.1 protein FAR1-RELATED SEQUENCE 5 [Sorghum bicolor]
MDSHLEFESAVVLDRDAAASAGVGMDSVAGAAIEIDDVTTMDIATGSVSIEAIDAGLGAYLEHPRTPRTEYSPSVAATSDTNNINSKEHLKPVVGMMFDSVSDVEKFYKSYAHEAGFSVRIGQQRKGDEEILLKRYYCSRQGFTKEKVPDASEESGKKRKAPKQMETRCGCPAHIVVKLDSDKKYRIVSMVEDHSHGFVSPDKRHLLRSNRRVSERVKSTLFNCQKASIGTSQAYRLLHVSEGGFENVGCTKRDLQNYYRDLRTKIKDADAQMFVAQLERKKEVNPAFFYEFEVNEEGRLVRVFWADALSRKNYNIFGDVISVDATYTTNQYNMKFVPFTGVNHHLQSVFLGAAFLANEKIESYVWLLKTFLKAMGGVAPHLITTDEDASMIAAIAEILPNTANRFCMWHIMDTTENSDDFESQWNSIMTDYGLVGNDWFSNRFAIRESWIPEQILAARDHCFIQGISECEDIKYFTINSQSGKERVVQMNKSNMFVLIRYLILQRSVL